MICIIDMVYTRHPNMVTTVRYNDVTMGAMASQITGFSIVCPTICSGAEYISAILITVQ